MRVTLPVDAHLAEIKDALVRRGALVIVAPPGTGKTTRVPPYLIREHGEVIVLEPRRLAAKLSALRVAEELGEDIGKTVGYRFRGESVGGPQTKLSYYTEGTLTRRMLRDPQLKGVHTVVIDEFHERHLTGDLALALLKDLKNNARKDLHLVVMSATLDAEGLARYLGDDAQPAPLVHVEAKAYPVEVEYLDASIETAVERAAALATGDMLVFLPGMGEILRAADRVSPIARRLGAIVTPLHGSLSKEEQHLAVTKNERRKIVLSTNIAESSLTIPGVTAVIDSGLHRQASFSWWSGVPLLATKAISRASAIQRAGRAGRLGPGVCLRLYSKGDFEGRAPFDTAEIQRADLTQTILELKAIGITDPSMLSWFEAPEVTRLNASALLLYQLGATENEALNAALTKAGRELSQVPIHPRLARMLIKASEDGILDEAAIAASALEAGEFRRSFAEGPAEIAVNTLKTVRTNRQEVSRLKNAAGRVSQGQERQVSADVRLGMAILSGFPDRIAKKKKSGGQVELVLSAGGSIAVVNNAVIASHELFVVCDAQEMKMGERKSVVVNAVVPIEEDWLLDLDPTPLREEKVLLWNREKARVFEADRFVCGEIVLSERIVPAVPSAEVTAFLLHQALGIKESPRGSLAEQWGVLKTKLEGSADVDALETELARAELLVGEQGLGRDLLNVIVQAIGELNSIGDLQRVNWAQSLSQVLPPEAIARKETLVPERIVLPSQRKAKVHYRMGQAPWVESRLQDFFGMHDTPRILNGKKALVVHLLAPNGRAVQVTQDLKSFWANTYAEVRRELMRRYPKHKWPEKPDQPFSAG